MYAVSEDAGRKSMAMKDEESKKKLINEKIVGRKLTLGRVLQSLLVALCCGLLFGGAAAFAFVRISRMQKAPQATAAMQETDTPAEPSSAALTLPQTTESESVIAGSETSEEGTGTEHPDKEDETVLPEESETLETAPTADMNATDSNADESELSEDPENPSLPEDDDGIRESTASADETETKENGEAEDTEPEDTSETAGTKIPDTADVIIAMQKRVFEITKPFVVTVNAITTGQTWFESPAESTQPYAGIILDMTEQEILILTTGRPTESKMLRITFQDGTTEDAYVKQLSVRDDLAVLAVPYGEDADVEWLSTIREITMSDSYAAEVGDPVIAIGAPLGVVGSCAFGSIGYVSETEPALDMSQRVLYADLRINPEKGSFIVNRDGELLGIAGEQSKKGSFDADLARIVTVGSVKNIIDRLEAGEKEAYIGLEGFAVSDEMLSNNIPYGMYITNVYTDSPAYNAGIKRGDIVTVVNDAKISDAFSYEEAVRALRPDETVSIAVRRGSADGEYRDISFLLTAGER